MRRIQILRLELGEHHAALGCTAWCSGEKVKWMLALSLAATPNFEKRLFPNLIFGFLHLGLQPHVFLLPGLRPPGLLPLGLQPPSGR